MPYNQRISEKSGTELQQLRSFITGIVERENIRAKESDFTNLLAEWYASVLEDLPQYEIEVQEAKVERSYTIVPLQHTNGTRTYRANVHIDNAFGDLVQRVQRTTDIILERVVAGQTNCFINTASQYGLTSRRSRSLQFPHPLPYMSPPPTTNEGKYTEEAGVIEAALSFVFSKQAPGIKLIIDEYKKQDNEGYWELGWATVNLYNDERILSINLNSLAYPAFNDNVWAGTIAHEILHNLGWGHPDGGYDKSKAIVNYDWCIRGGASFRMEEGIDDSKLIR